MPKSLRSPRHDRLLKKARKEQGLTQQELAIRLKRKQSFVTKYETGERRLDVIEFLEIAGALAQDPAELLTEIAKVPKRGGTSVGDTG
jgi:transcriptional regulator with XRE-family HTH domain